MENEIPDNLKYLINHQIFDTAELKRQKVGFSPNNKTLIIPQYDNQTNLFTGYQTIYQDGRKLYLKGSKQKDVSFTFKPTEENNIVLIAEGFATSACLFLALKKN